MGLFLFVVACSCFTVFAWAHVPVAQPFFQNPTMDLEVIENTTVWLPCNVENLGDNVVRWWRGETLLADTSDHSHPRPARVRLWLNNTLEVSQVNRKDSGDYACQVVRKEPWNPLQLQHSLTVLFPPTISQEPASGEVNVRLGDSIEMACLAEGEPAPKVTWRSQDREIVNGQEKQHVLTLKAISPKMSLTYTCIADNGVASPATADFQVRVLYKPIVIADASWQHAAPGLQAQLTCGVSAEPPARVQWFLGDQVIDTGSSQRVAPYVQGHQHTLNFRNITAEDFGEYRCRATNSEGISEATVQLSGRARPAVFKRNVPRLNDSAVLIWQVDSYSPIIDYHLKFRQVPAPDDDQWISIVVPADGQSPGPIHTKSYNLSGLETAATYEAVVSSRNRYGLSAPSHPFLFATQGAEFSINGSDEESSEEESNSAEQEAAVSMEENAILQGAITFGRGVSSRNTALSNLVSYLTIMIMTMWVMM